jgi:osmotically-inducible protein OsmY
MAATFDNTLPTARDRARYQLGDTNVAAPLEQDATYDANLALYGDALAIAVMAEALASRYAQQPSSIGSQGDSIAWGERIRTWLALAQRIRDEQSVSGAAGAGSLVGTRCDETYSEYLRPVAGCVWWNG